MWRAVANVADKEHASAILDHHTIRVQQQRRVIRMSGEVEHQYHGIASLAFRQIYRQEYFRWYDHVPLQNLRIFANGWRQKSILAPKFDQSPNKI